ncbi:MAG: hypothetical protein WA399_06290, partial [Acidobacteriaceae bacterium]
MPEVENDISLFSLSGRITGIHVFHGAKLPDSRHPCESFVKVEQRCPGRVRENAQWVMSGLVVRMHASRRVVPA